MNPWLITLPIAYLLGSIPTGYLLVRLVRKQDIRAIGSGNIGATNVMRSGAKGLGIATLVLDLSKALLAVVFAHWIAPGNGDLAMLAALAAVLGHIFPVWLGFRGGKGVACALGVFIALLPWPATVALLALFLAVVVLTRYVSLGSILGAMAFPVLGFYFLRHPSPVQILGLIAIPALVIAKHHANIRRLLAGTENRFGSPRKAAA
jgi:glycerol-3-phosphate acyltransferase PlsY